MQRGRDDRGAQTGAILLLAMFAANATLFALPPMLPSLAAELSLSVAAAGQLRTMAALVAAAATLGVAVLARRWDLRDLMSHGLLLTATGSLLAAASSGWATLAAAHVLMGAGAALVLPAGLAASSQWATRPEEVARLLSWTLSGPGVAAIVVTPVAGALAEHWRVVWVAMPAATGLAALVAVRTRPPGGALAAPRAGGAAAWRLPGVRGWLVGELLSYSGWSVVVVYAVALLVQTYAVSPALAGGALSASAALFVAGTSLARHVELGRSTLVACALTLALGVGTLGVVRVGFAFSATVLGLVGLVNGFRLMAGSAFGLSIAGTRAVEAMALRTTAQQVGYLTGAGLGGAALAVGGYAAVGLLGLTMLALAAAPHTLALVRPVQGTPKEYHDAPAGA